MNWWHGRGAFLDYGNPEAVAWWEAQMSGVLGCGVDGWKVDGTDPFVAEIPGPRSMAGHVTLAMYQNWTYGHFFNFTRQVRGPGALIWSRPVDSYPVALNISAFLRYSPPYVMFSGWVGDQDPTFSGLRQALVNMFASAWNNYTNFGSDTAGYRSARPPRTPDEFLRWAQVNAFLPLFENGAPFKRERMRKYNSSKKKRKKKKREAGNGEKFFPLSSFSFFFSLTYPCLFFLLLPKLAPWRRRR